MSFSLLPTEIKKHISSFITPSNTSVEEVKICGRCIKQISLVNKELRSICSDQLSTFKKIHRLLNKYNNYQHKNYVIDLVIPNPKGAPHLLDALFTGQKITSKSHAFYRCGLLFSTFHKYNQEIENDIKEIVKLTPQSVNCILGKNSVTGDLTPLVVACINPNIPVHIIEFLLEKGANPNTTIKVHGQSVHILYFMKQQIQDGHRIPTIEIERLSKIENLFKKYGAEF